MEKFYCKLLARSIMRIVNRLNRIANWLVDVYSDYSKEEKVNE